MSSNTSKRVQALQKITKRLPAQLLYYGSALGAIVLATGGQLPSGLEFVAGGIGANIMSNLVDEIARGDNVEEDVIQERVQSAVDKSDIANLLTKQDFLQGYVRLLNRLDAQKIISEDILDELRTGFNKVATANQVEELKQLLIQRTTENTPYKTYLTNLISHLQNRAMGVLQYVDVSSSASMADTSSRFSFDLEEFGFSEIIKDKSKPHRPELVKLGNIRDAIAKHPRFVLLGGAGGSKTTTIRRLALEQAKLRLQDPALSLPLLFDLPRWEDETSVEEFVMNQWRNVGLPTQVNPIALLRDGQATLYLDGLNEMGGRGASKAVMLKKWLQSINTPKQVIITCRTENYDFLELGLPTVQIDPLTDTQIRLFCENYLGSQCPEFLELILAKGNNPDERSLHRLAQNPYMLAALIIIYMDVKKLPRNYGRLFEKMVIGLATREVKRNSSGWQPFNQQFAKIERALAKLAFEMIDKDKGTQVTLAFTKNFVDEETLTAARSANLIVIEGNQVRFYHQLLLEYFCGLAQLRKLAVIDLNQLVGYTDAYKISYEATKWDKVVIALFGIQNVGENTKLLDVLVDRKPFLAADCVIESNYPTWPIAEKITYQILQHTLSIEEDALALGLAGGQF